MKLTKCTLLFAMFVTLTNISCDFNNNKAMLSAKNEITIPYTVAKNYFVKNTYTPALLQNNLIQTQAQLDTIFGMAATGGEDGLPSQIDFTKQFAMAFISEPTTQHSTLTIEQVSKTDSVITVQYTLTEEGKTSYTKQPFLLLIVDKKHQGVVNFVKK